VLDVIHHENVHGCLARFELQAQLLTKGLLERGTVGIERGAFRPGGVRPF
jgi:hypothetical protein